MIKYDKRIMWGVTVNNEIASISQIDQSDETCGLHIVECGLPSKLNC